MVAYARSGKAAIAFEVVGDGPVDLIYLPGFINNLEVIWDNPLLARFLERLATFSRLVIVDRRGSGLSDRLSPEDLPPLEDLADDITAVMDTVGIGRAALMGSSDCGSLCAMFAASHPERTIALILYAAGARGAASEDFASTWTIDEWERYLMDLRGRWGTLDYARETLAWFDPSLQGRDDLAAWYASFQRLAASPNAAEAIERIYQELDVRAVLPTINVPTLVLNRSGDTIEYVDAAKYVAQEIPGARFVELPGDDHHAWAGDQDAVLREIEQFLSEIHGGDTSLDRVLATVLFTDIVDSTATAAVMGDAKWRSLLEEHDRIAKGLIGRYRGEYRRSTGDGLMATFDGPARAVRCAQDFVEAVKPLGIEVRTGAHTGEITYGENDLAGIGVHVAARVASMAGASEVWASSTVKDLTAGSGLAFEDAGEHELKGVPGVWHVYRVVS